MKTLPFSIPAFLLVLVLFHSNPILAQNETLPQIGFDYPDYFTKKMNCDVYNTGKISPQDREQKKATIIVTDPSANKFSTSIDRITVSVWSDSDKKGIEITAFETEVNSGIFKGTVTISDGPSTQDTIHVADGDTLSAKYSSSTPWSPNSTNRGVKTTAFIGATCPPMERVSVSGIHVVDKDGNEQKILLENKQIQIRSNLTNLSIRNQTFSYIVQILDKDKIAESFSWLSGMLLPSQTLSPSISWTPSKAGNHTVNVFVWQSIDNPNSLSPPVFTDLTVWSSMSAYTRSTIRNAENLQCESGYELVIKSSKNSSACVTEKTAHKLVERGWAKNLESHFHSIHKVSVASVKMVPQITPGGPIIQLTLKNIGIKPITSLKAVLELYNNYTFEFKDVTSFSPLGPDSYTSDKEMLVGGGFQTELAYPLIITGMQDNIPFSYTEKVHIQG